MLKYVKYVFSTIYLSMFEETKTKYRMSSAIELLSETLTMSSRRANLLPGTLDNTYRQKYADNVKQLHNQGVYDFRLMNSSFYIDWNNYSLNEVDFVYEQKLLSL